MSEFLKLLREKTKLLHEEVGNKPFLVRYKQQDFALLDHYNHLCQLRRIYGALEAKMKAVCQKFNDEFGYLLERYNEINKDIAFLDKKFDKPMNGYQICAATTRYEEYINKLDMENRIRCVNYFWTFFNANFGRSFWRTAS